ncbi:MAG: LCP family protein [Cellulosilyticaceae bacterium]
MQKRKIKALLKIFAISASVTMVMAILVIMAGITAYNAFIYQAPTTPTQQAGKDEVEGNKQEEHITKPLDPTINQTVAIFGTDISGLLTDSIMVANFNSQTKEINVISMPRDTQVRWTDEQKAYLPSRNSWVEISKLNEMTSWGGIENIRGLTVNQIERFLGMKVDHYVIVSLSAFRDIVDAIDGVEVNVPQRMYKEEVNGGLCIDLYPGVQVLDGNKAEQFVRFRDYKTGDLGRIDAQQQFVEAFIKKVLSPEIITKIPGIVTTLFSSVKTDIRLSELPEYYTYISKLPECKVTFHRAPGTDRRENGISYYFIDIEAMGKMVDELFFKTSIQD